MRSGDLDIIFVAGLGGSEPEHWQRRWAAKLPNARFVEQADWQKPDFAAWTGAIAAACALARRPIVFAAHSLGVLAAIHAAAGVAAGRIKGAFLVAPPDDAALAQIGCGDFALAPAEALPFAARLVASRDDPYCRFARSQALALELGASLIDAGAAGHLNVASGHGPWPEGLMQFAGLLRSLDAG